MIADMSKNDTKKSEYFPKENRKWYFDPVLKELTTDVDGVLTSLNVLDNVKNW